MPLHTRVPRNDLERRVQSKLRPRRFALAIERLAAGVERRCGIYRRCLCCRRLRWDDRQWAMDDLAAMVAQAKRRCGSIACSEACWQVLYDAYGRSWIPSDDDDDE